MNSIKRKSAIAAIAAVLLASAFGAQAADNVDTTETPQAGSFDSPGSAANYAVTQQRVAAPTTTDRAERILENFEKQLSMGSVETYDPAEHPPVVQRQSLVTRTSPFDRFDLASPGG